MSHNRPPYVFVAGAAVLDVIASIEKYDPPIAHDGTIKLAVGGMACNMAMNLKTLGSEVTFLTALNSSPVSRIIQDHILGSGIRAVVHNAPNMKEAVFSGHIHQGELETAVLSSHMRDIDFSKNFLIKTLGQAMVMAVSCELSVVTLQHLSTLATEKNIPLFISALSRREAHQLDDVHQRIDVVFMRKSDAEGYAHDRGCADLRALAQTLNTTLVLTQGNQGDILLMTPTFHEQVPVTNLPVMGKSLGAGDLLMAASVHYLVTHRLPLIEAVKRALYHIPALLAHNHANLADNDSVMQHLARTFTAVDYDHLTGLLNRHGVETYLSRMNDDDDVYVFLVDIDHFKQVNDHFGHEVGDAALSHVAGVLMDCSRQGDIIGRWGGEEFVCLIHAPADSHALAIADRYRQSVASSIVHAMGKPVTISVGVSKIGRGAVFANYLKAADTALYRAKHQGRNRVILADNL